MRHQYENGDNRSQDTRAMYRQDDGRYQGTDYEDPRASRGIGRNRQGDVFSGQQYGQGHSQRHGSRDREMGLEYGRDPHRHEYEEGSLSSRRGAGRYSGYATEEAAGYGRDWPGAREYAEAQYGRDEYPRGLFRDEEWHAMEGASGHPYGAQSYGAQYGRHGGHAGAYRQDIGAQGGYGPGARGGYGLHAGRGLGNDGPLERDGDWRQGQGRGPTEGWDGGAYAQPDEGRYGRSSGYGHGGHRGKGPRDYSRSDERIAEDINERLMQDDVIDASDIKVTVSNGEVTLEGTVQARSLKHRAEDLAECCAGVKDVDNRIRVRRREDDSDTTSSSRPTTSTSTAQASGTTTSASAGKGGSSGSSGRATS